MLFRFCGTALLFDVYDQRWLILDAIVTIHHLGHLGECSQVRLVLRLPYLLLETFLFFPFHQPHDLPNVDVLVPDVESAHTCHMLSQGMVLLYTADDRLPV